MRFQRNAAIDHAHGIRLQRRRRDAYRRSAADRCDILSNAAFAHAMTAARDRISH